MALEDQGLKEEAEQFGYRTQTMQRKAQWWSLWQEKQTLWQRWQHIGTYFFSLLLFVLTGYGYRFGRTFLSYVSVLFTFVVFYHFWSLRTLGWYDASIFSIQNMVGRGFFNQNLNDSYAGWSVLEGVIGVFMDVLLVSTLTQRFFKK